MRQTQVGKMFQSVVKSGIILTFLSVAAFGESGEAGAFHTMGTPCRLFDSRWGSGQIPSQGLQILDVRYSGFVFGGAFHAPLVKAPEPLPRTGYIRRRSVSVNSVAPPSASCTIPDDASHGVFTITVVNATANGSLKPLWSNGLYSSLGVVLMNYGPAAYGNTSSWTIIPLCGDTWGECDQDFGIFNAGTQAVDIVVELYGWMD